MEYSKIFLNLNNFIDLQKKFANQNENYEKKIQKIKIIIIKIKKAFYFEDYLETNKKE